MRSWRSWHHKNLTFFFLSVMAAIFLSRLTIFHDFLLHLGGWGYLGAFLAGIFFVSIFTVATGALILLILAETLSPWEIGLFAGLGAVIGDFTIFKFVKDSLIEEVKPLYERLGDNHLKQVFHSKYFRWTLPVIGAIIIASPLPDEIGVSLMGISKMKTYQFLLVSFVLNALGIFLIISASIFIKP